MTTATQMDRTQHSSSAPAQANESVRKWVQECVELCQSNNVVWCDGSKAEADRLYEKGVREGTLIKLNQQRLPGCYLHRSNPNDVARSEHLTFICTPSADMAGRRITGWSRRRRM